MSGDSTFLIKNHILNSLPADELERIRPHLERVELPSGKVLYSPQEKITHVYFPDHAIISVVAHTDAGQGAEIAVIGVEGAIGLDVIMGSDTTSNENITQLADGAWKVKTSIIREEFERCSDLQDLLLQFVRRMIAQISQNALCNQIHTTEKRLSRWLLMCRDRSDSNVIIVTQEFISLMLGASRATVTLTAIKLQDLGLISYKRGHITILDRAGLEAFTCPCYETIREAYLN